MHSFYSLTDGVFTGGSIDIRPFDQAKLDANIPPGCGALEGSYDHLSQRVNLADTSVVVYQPPAPAANDYQTWSWNADTKRWVPTPTLTALKANKWTSIKRSRDVTETAGFDTPYGRFDSDEVSQTKIIGAVTAAGIAGPTFSIDWTLQNNSKVTLNQAQMVEVGMLLLQHVNSNHQRGSQKREQIEAASDPEEVEAVTWES